MKTALMNLAVVFLFIGTNAAPAMADTGEIAVESESIQFQTGLRCCPVNGVQRCGTKIDCDLAAPATSPCPLDEHLFCHNGHDIFCRCVQDVNEFVGNLSL